VTRGGLIPSWRVPSIVLASICAAAILVTWARSWPEARRSAAARAQVEAVYTEDTRLLLQLTVDADGRAALETKPRRFVAGQVELAGSTYPARIRLKGHRSLRKLDEKPAFKLQLDLGDGERPLALTLNNQVEDPTLLREVLAYRLLNALGLPAPRTGFVRVRLNGSGERSYLLVETIDESFLERRFGRGPGALYEGEYGCDVSPPDVGGFDLDAGEDPERGHLAAFAAASLRDAPDLFTANGPLDMHNFLTYLAASALIGDFDGYRHSHNYYLYFHVADQKWRFVPWGLDRVFKKPIDVYDSQGLLARRCFGDATCRLEYARTLAKVTASFESLDLPRLAHELAEKVDARNAGAGLDAKDLRTTQRARKAQLAFLRERAAIVRAQLSCLDASGRELDHDGDGYGCLDCNDQDAAIHPGAREGCDGVDDDCSGLSDDAAACGCQSRQLGEREFQLCPLPMPWAQAQAFCKQMGLVLARIDSAHESQALYRAAHELDPQRWWIGYSDQNREGDFRWQDGGASSFTYWKRGQPDNGTCNEDCVALRQDGNGRWQDTHCGQPRPFICSGVRKDTAAMQAEP
jgi:CotH protein/lectin-like protein/putative metal-binding protein